MPNEKLLFASENLSFQAAILFIKLFTYYRLAKCLGCRSISICAGAFNFIDFICFPCFYGSDFQQLMNDILTCIK